MSAFKDVDIQYKKDITTLYKMKDDFDAAKVKKRYFSQAGGFVRFKGSVLGVFNRLKCKVVVSDSLD